MYIDRIGLSDVPCSLVMSQLSRWNIALSEIIIFVVIITKLYIRDGTGGSLCLLQPFRLLRCTLLLISIVFVSEKRLTAFNLNMSYRLITKTSLSPSIQNQMMQLKFVKVPTHLRRHFQLTCLIVTMLFHEKCLYWMPFSYRTYRYTILVFASPPLSLVDS